MIDRGFEGTGFWLKGALHRDLQSEVTLCLLLLITVMNRIQIEMKQIKLHQKCVEDRSLLCVTTAFPNSFALTLTSTLSHLLSLSLLLSLNHSTHSPLFSCSLFLNIRQGSSNWYLYFEYLKQTYNSFSPWKSLSLIQSITLYSVPSSPLSSFRLHPINFVVLVTQSAWSKSLGYLVLRLLEANMLLIQSIGIISQTFAALAIRTTDWSDWCTNNSWLCLFVMRSIAIMTTYWLISWEIRHLQLRSTYCHAWVPPNNEK